MRLVAIAASAIFFASAALTAPVATTPSGQPEGRFEQTTLSDAGGKIASRCMDLGWTVTGQTANQVTCQMPFGGVKQALAGALLGNAYSTPPNTFVQVSLAQVGENVRAQARAWMETQMAFGQLRQMPFDNVKNKSDLMGFLESAGAILPAGTTFSGNFLGIANDPTNKSQIMVRHVFTHSPAALAGIKRGDQITAINGRPVKDDKDFGKRLGKLQDPTYTLGLVRAGQPLTLTVQRQGMPAAGTAEYEAQRVETLALNP